MTPSISMTPDQNRPGGGTIQGPSASEAQAQGGSPIGQPAAVSPVGSDAYKSLDQTGTSIAADMGLKPVSPKADQGGDNSNVSSNDAGKSGGFPMSGKSRAPVTGSAPGPRNRGRTRTR